MDMQEALRIIKLRRMETKNENCIWGLIPFSISSRKKPNKYNRASDVICDELKATHYIANKIDDKTLELIFVDTGSFGICYSYNSGTEVGRFII